MSTAENFLGVLYSPLSRRVNSKLGAHLPSGLLVSASQIIIRRCQSDSLETRYRQFEFTSLPPSSPSVSELTGESPEKRALTGSINGCGAVAKAPCARAESRSCIAEAVWAVPTIPLVALHPSSCPNRLRPLGVGCSYSIASQNLMHSGGCLRMHRDVVQWSKIRQSFAARPAGLIRKLSSPPSSDGG